MTLRILSSLAAARRLALSEDSPESKTSTAAEAVASLTTAAAAAWAVIFWALCTHQVHIHSALAVPSETVYSSPAWA